MKRKIIKLILLFLNLRTQRGRRVFLVFWVNLILKIKRRLKLKVTKLLSKVFGLIPNGALKSKLYKFLSVSGSARRYIKKDYTIESFFEELNRAGLGYVILRWYENLPEIQAGEDIDILIRDQDIARINSYLTRDPSGQAIDLYSVSGLRGTDYHSTPYIAPHLAQDIIDNKAYHKNIYAVPNDMHALLSMAYHVVFHKGSQSMLSYDGTSDANAQKADHDYVSVLKELAQKAHIEINDYSFLGLFEFLKNHGWVPENDTLRLYGQRGEWIASLLPKPQKAPFKGSLITFVIRKWALDNNKMDDVLYILKRNNLDVLGVYNLDEEQQTRAKYHIRGGKWDRGSFSKSGGDPVALVVCYNYHPKEPSDKVKKNYPYLEDARAHVKHKIRDHINEELFLSQQVNPIHASDNFEEALDYLKLCLSETEINHISMQIQIREQLYQTEYEVLEVLSADNTRSKTEKIIYNGVPAVKKTFKVGCEEFCAREAFVYEEFSSKAEFIPKLLEKSDNYIIIPWVDDILKELNPSEYKKTLKQHGQDIINAMKFFYDEGYALIGFYDQNVMITDQGKVVLIDFEFLYKYQDKPASFLQSYDIAGLPKDFEGDTPRGIKGKGHTYKNTWKRYLGPIGQYQLDK